VSPFNAAAVDRIIEKYGSAGGTLIGILTDIQKEYTYLPQEALRRVGERLEIPLSQVFSVCTFYKIFSLTPRGKHSIKVCLGTACHVKGAALILDRLRRDLDIPEGGTTKDGKFTLETVRCVGCCSIAPVVTVDETAYGRLKQEQLSGIIAGHGTEAPRPAQPARTSAPRREKPSAAGRSPARKSPARPKAGGSR
jgi:NADH:ubiquinone oxidoreductase subunit E